MTTLSIPRRKRPDTPPDTSAQNTNPQDGSRQDGLASAASLPQIPARRQRSPKNASASDSPTVRKKRAPYYPTGDGKPMAEDVLHVALMTYVLPALMHHFRLRPDAHVAGNDFVYYEEGNPKARVSPDCYVVFGVEPKPIRHSYKVWEENGIAPAVVFEFTSKKTKKEDVTLKRPLYEQILRVAEYFQFDPTGDYLRPRLQGQRLTNGVYEPIELRDDRMTSEQLGLELVIEGETLRLYDPATGEYLRTYAQAETQRVAEQQRAELEAQRAELEARRAESEQQRAEAEARRAAEEAQRADSETRRAEDQTQRAESEKQRAEVAEAELRRLRQELDALRHKQQ